MNKKNFKDFFFKNFQLLFQYKKVSPDRVLPFVIVLTGLLCGFTAVSFKAVIHFLEKILYLNTAFVLPNNFHYFIITAGLSFIAGLLLWKVFPDSKGGGIPQLKTALFYQFGIIPVKNLIGKFITAALCIGGGLAVGPEGPTIFICGALGAWIGKIFSFKQFQIKNLVISGSAAGLAAAFNTPISGIMFVFEELLGNLSTKIIGTTIISCVLASTMQRLLVGNKPSLNVPMYRLVQPFELFYYLGLGIFCGIVSFLLIKSLLFFSKKFLSTVKPNFKTIVLPMIAAGAIVGACAVILPAKITGFGYNPVILEDNENNNAVFYKSTFKTIDNLQKKISNIEKSTGEIVGPAASMYKQMEDVFHNSLPIGTIIGIFILKFIIITICFAARPPGGVFLPVLFLGAMAGGIFGTGVNMIDSVNAGKAGAYAIVGMGALLAGVMKAPITSILIIFEMTNNYKIILPLMLANMVSYTVSRYFYKYSIYDGILQSQGVFLNYETLDLKSIKVSEVMSANVKSMPEELSVSDAWLNFNFYNFYSFPVVNSEGAISGILKQYMLKDKIKKKEWFYTVKDVISNQQIPYIYENDDLDNAIKLLGSFETNVLPVLNNSAEKKPVGIISHKNIIKYYSKNSGRV